MKCAIYHQGCILILFILTGPVLVCGGQTERRSHTADLIHDLLHKDPSTSSTSSTPSRRYSNQVRPVFSPNTTTSVNIRMNLHQFIALNAKDQYMKAITWFSLVGGVLIVWSLYDCLYEGLSKYDKWKDEFLSWEPEDYGGVSRFHVQSSRIWRPDLLLYNSVDEGKSSSSVLADTMAIVDHMGNIWWTTSALLKTSCHVNVAMYPFDTHSCHLKLGSWTYGSTEVNLACQEEEAAGHDLAPNSEWHIIRVPCSTNIVKYECCEVKFSDITFLVVVKRKPMFYLYNLLFPCVMLCVIGILVFYIPSESGEKASLSVTVLLAMTVFLMVIMENVPATSDVIPLLDQFFGAVIGILSISTIMSFMLAKCQYRGGRSRPPPWIRRYILGWLAKVLIVNSSGCQDGQKKKPAKPLEKQFTGNDVTGRHDSILENGETIYQASCHRRSGSTGTLDSSMLSSVVLQLELIREHIRGTLEDKAEAEAVQLEWSAVTDVMDRFFLLLFTLSLMSACIGIFCQIPG